MPIKINLLPILKKSFINLKIYPIYINILSYLKRSKYYPYWPKFKEYLGSDEPIDLEISLTYKCNLDCKYCYAKGLRNNYDYISFNDIKKIIKWLKRQNKNKIRLIGGEPTIHPQIKEILTYCNKYKINYELITNGIYDSLLNLYLNSKNTISVQINFDQEQISRNLTLYNKFIKNIEHLQSRNIPVILKYNIIENLDFMHGINLAKKYRLHINFTPPNLGLNNSYFINWEKVKPKYLKNICDFVQTCKDNGIYCFIGRPLPRCVFSKKKWKFLKRYASIRAVCGLGNKKSSDGGFQVMPDLKILICANVFLFKNKKVIEYKNIEEIKNEYENYISYLKWKVPLFDKCNNCPDFLNKKCQGGCIGNKLNKISVFKGFTKIK